MIFEHECEDGLLKVRLRDISGKEIGELNYVPTYYDEFDMMFVEGTHAGDPVELYEIHRDEKHAIMLKYSDFLDKFQPKPKKSAESVTKTD